MRFRDLPDELIGDKTTKNLNLILKGLEDLDGIEEFQELVNLDIIGNNIKSLEPLREIKTLFSISATNNLISDASPLLGSKDTLYRICLRNNLIYNLNPFAEMPKLRELNLSENKIKFLGKVEKLGDLSHLYLSGNKIEKINVFNFREMFTLDLAGNPIVEFKGIDSMRNLRKLNITGIKTTVDTKNLWQYMRIYK